MRVLCDTGWCSREVGARRLDLHPYLGQRHRPRTAGKERLLCVLPGGGDNRCDLAVLHVTLLYRLTALVKPRRLIGVLCSVPKPCARGTTPFPCLLLTQRVRATPMMISTAL